MLTQPLHASFLAAERQKLDIELLKRLQTDVVISGSHNDQIHLKPYHDPRIVLRGAAHPVHARDCLEKAVIRDVVSWKAPHATALHAPTGFCRCCSAVTGCTSPHHRRILFLAICNGLASV
jgi:hypothetical protein